MGMKTRALGKPVADQRRLVGAVVVHDDVNVQTRRDVCLDLIEEPHLGRLMEKIAAPGRPALDRLDFARPATAAVEPSLNANVSQES